MKKLKPKKFFTLRRFNNYLSVIILLLSFYIILAPFWPQAAISIQKDPPLVAQEKSDAPEEQVPGKNTLVIPRLKLQQEIHEGGEEALNKGVWRTPSTGTPLDSNMVLSGHRFTYGGPAVFYHLDKVKNGDQIVVYWQKKKYRFEVTNTFIVQPTQVEILAPSDKPKLTIYTCTPLWSASHRLVITAELMGDDQ